MAERPGHLRHASEVRAGLALLTVSDTRTESDDRSGLLIRSLVEAAGHRIVDYRLLPDEPDEIRSCVQDWLARDDCDAIVVNGGTGVARRDRTHEAVARLLDRRLDGFGELFRMLSYEQVGSAAMLSRAIAGIARGKPLFSVPGSPGAAELALSRLILPELGHLLSELRK
jgi:molybdenum cofactor biosynthesis protein B